MHANRVAIEAVDPASEAARSCLDRYYAELLERFEETYVKERHPEPPRESFLPPLGRFLCALSEGHPIGCGGLTTHAPGVALITRMWVAPEARRIGLGRRLLVALERAASELDFESVRLDTNRSLVEARKLYEAAGYRRIEAFNESPYADFWFEKRLGNGDIEDSRVTPIE